MPSNFQRLIAYQKSIALVGANIAEASGRWHENDRRQFLRIARGSLLETEHWVTYSEKRGLLAHETSTKLEEVARLLNGLIRKLAPEE